MKLKQTYRLKYTTHKIGDITYLISNSFFIDGVLHGVVIFQNQLIICHLGSGRIAFERRVKNIRAAKVLARRWVNKQKSSLLQELRKVL